MTSTQNTTAQTVRLTGRAALDYAARHGLELCKHSDPTEGAREGLSVDEAERIAREDAELVYLDAPVVYRIAPRDSHDWDLAGEGNEFSTVEEACSAAESMDETNPLEGDDEWCVYEIEPGSSPTCLTERLPSDLVVVEMMPHSHRSSHENAGAGYLSIAGCYPMNGAKRFLMRRAQAADEVAADEEWTRIIGDARESDIAELVEVVDLDDER